MPRRPNRDHTAVHNYTAKMLDGLLHEDSYIRELYWDLWDRMTREEQEKWERLALVKTVRELSLDEGEWVDSIMTKYDKESN